MSEDGETAKIDSMNRYDLYQIKVSGTKVGKARKIDSNVYHNVRFIDNDRYVYYKKVDESGQNGDMYMDGTKVESDVRLNAVKYDKNTENLWYIVDWEEQEQYGTLKKYNGDKIVKISDEVYCYEILLTGDVLYLYDYNIENYEGELYLYKKKKSQKVDDDVVTIIPMKE